MVLRSLKALPADLETTYIQAMKESQEGMHGQDAGLILMWLTYAFEPLSLDQIAEILDVDLETQEVEYNDQSNLQVHMIIDSNLVTVTPENIVQLAHISVKEFIIHNAAWNKTIKLIDLNEQLAHDQISQTLSSFKISG